MTDELKRMAVFGAHDEAEADGVPDSGAAPVRLDSDEQAAVIDAPTNDDVLVVAGAGSGKTYTMTRRIVTLIRRGVPAEKILGLTFTNKAASELSGRVSAAVADSGDGSRNPFLKPQVLTYDAFFQSIVRQYGLLVGFDQNTQPLSEAGSRQLAVSVIDENMDLVRGQGLGDFDTVVDDVLALAGAIGGSVIGAGCLSVKDGIERVRRWDAAFLERLDALIGDEQIPVEEPDMPKCPKRRKKDSDKVFEQRLEDYRAESDRAAHDVALFRSDALRTVVRRREVLLDLVEAYDERKKSLDMAEFNDFTIAAHALVTRFPSIGERFRRRYTHVLLDEYQDTSTTQAALIAALFHPKEGRGSAVTAVGDPFQSIYAWRGASPGAFRMFQRDFGAEGRPPYALRTTRRNSRLVLEAANDLTEPLRRASMPRSSSLMTEVDVPKLDALPEASEGTLGVLGFDTRGQEIDAVIRFAKAVIARHTPSDPDAKDSRPHVAVLFRGKAQMEQFAQGLRDAGLSTVVVGYSALLDRPEIRDVMAVLHVAADHTDAASLMRLLATPRFGLGRSDLAALAGLASRRNDEYRYRALAAAGVVSPDAKPDARAALVAKHRDQVPNMVFLPDLVVDGELDLLLNAPGTKRRFTAKGLTAIEQVSDVLRQVNRVLNRPLSQIVATAVEALGLDIDTVVAQALNDHTGAAGLDPTQARSPMEALADLVDTFTREIAQDQAPTLRGFVSWVDSLDTVNDTAAPGVDEPADVVLMTAHQSKGLEWDAVAMVGLARSRFPSNQGDHLAIEEDPDHPGKVREDGSWQPPLYTETARTWLDAPAAVPVPVRADAGILPRFPHDLAPGGDPIDALGAFDSVEAVVREAEGLGSVTTGVANESTDEPGAQGSGDASQWLDQRAEFGRRLHADERRLAYVALTRARYEALLTYSRSTDEGRMPDESGKVVKAKPSNFWQEVDDALCTHVGVVAADADPAPPAADSRQEGPQTLDALGMERPDGFFVGDDAAAFKRAVVDCAWTEPLEHKAQSGPLPWPVKLSSGLASQLDWSARVASQGAESVRKPSNQKCRTAADGGERVPNGVGREPAAVLPEGESLLARTRMLLDDEYLCPTDPLNGSVLSVASGSAGEPDASDRHLPVAAHRTPEGGAEAAFDAEIRRRGEHVLAARRRNVTSLQAGVSRTGGVRDRAYWRGIVRPIPQVSSPTAEAGTRFHAWAELFVNAFDDADIVGAEESDSGQLTAGDARRTRAALVADLAQDLSGAGGGSALPSKADRTMIEWCRRLADSRWARRRPYAAEMQIVVAVPELGDAIVNGKLDAVFYGGLDENDKTTRFTIVDWKTGKKPVGSQEINEKLLQLDLYRLLFSQIAGCPMEFIDATLYYIDRANESDREIHAQPKSREEIIEEFKNGIPETSDND